MRLAASRPAEDRGLARDGVRMLVATTDGLAHATFADLPRYLTAGDLLVVNTSATLAAAVDGHRGGDRPVTVHFSTPLDDGTWLVELREPAPGHGRVTDACPGDRIALPERASLTLLSRYPDPGADRLWTASFSAPTSGRRGDGSGGDAGVATYLARQGRPIRYSYVPEQWPLPAYQTVFSREPGSAEMPSAGRPFTPDLVLALITSGVVDRADHAARRGGVAGSRRAAAAGAVRGARADRRAGQPDQGSRPPRGRGRHHGHPRAGERRQRAERHAPRGRRPGAGLAAAGPTSCSGPTAPRGSSPA